MIWFFDRDGERLRYEISHDRSKGKYKVVVTRPDGRQRTAVTTWEKPDELTRALALGLVQGARERTRTPEQLEHASHLLGQTLNAIAAKRVAMRAAPRVGHLH